MTRVRDIALLQGGCRAGRRGRRRRPDCRVRRPPVTTRCARGATSWWAAASHPATSSSRTRPRLRSRSRRTCSPATDPRARCPGGDPPAGRGPDAGRRRAGRRRRPAAAAVAGVDGGARCRRGLRARPARLVRARARPDPSAVPAPVAARDGATHIVGGVPGPLAHDRVLAVALVAATVAAVAGTAVALVPGLERVTAAIALGAMVAPPDPIAVEAVAGPVRMPRRLLTVLQSEGCSTTPPPW